MIGTDKPGSPSELVLLHYGKKGMKWGIRKAYENKAINKAARFRRVASGRGSATDTIRTAAGLSTYQLVKGRGIKGGARLKAESLEQHLARRERGKTKVNDILRESGGILFLNMYDLSATSRKNYYSRK